MNKEMNLRCRLPSRSFGGEVLRKHQRERRVRRVVAGHSLVNRRASERYEYSVR